ncbi:MAG TPA: polysaccharide deacetylase family protein [Solirubrobacteraceae bacterium]|nr:polysaccharide deacetylase family protein [Solirubrobacteraceae bacterium]
MSDRPPSRHARTVAVAALVTGFVLFVLAIALAFDDDDGGGGGGDGTRASGTTATTPRTARRPRPRAPVYPAEPAVPANAPGAHRDAEESVPILAYDVINSPREGTADPSIWVPPEEFREQMAFLADNGYHAITMRQLWAAWREKGLLPSKPVVISFDTGYHSVYANALPAMRERAFSGVLFLDPNQTQSDFPVSEVQALIRAGWELGAQPAGDNLDVLAARRTLQRRFRRRVQFFSYPEGRFDPSAPEALESSGFLAAVTLDEGLASPDDPRYELDRIPVRNGDGAEGLERKLGEAADG